MCHTENTWECPLLTLTSVHPQSICSSLASKSFNRGFLGRSTSLSSRHLAQRIKMALALVFVSSRFTRISPFSSPKRFLVSFPLHFSSNPQDQRSILHGHALSELWFQLFLSTLAVLDVSLLILRNPTSPLLFQKLWFPSQAVNSTFFLQDHSHN